MIAEVGHGMHVLATEWRGLVVTFAGLKDSGARLVADDSIVMDLDYLQQNNRQLQQTPTNHRKRDLKAPCQRVLVIISNCDLSQRCKRVVNQIRSKRNPNEGVNTDVSIVDSVFFAGMLDSNGDDGGNDENSSAIALEMDHGKHGFCYPNNTPVASRYRGTENTRGRSVQANQLCKILQTPQKSTKHTCSTKSWTPLTLYNQTRSPSSLWNIFK